MERRVGVIARVPLDEGGLTGKIHEHTEFQPNDFRSRYFKGDRKQQVAEHVAAIEQEIGIQNGAMPEVAPRFCLSHPAVSTVIPRHAYPRERGVQLLHPWKRAAAGKGALHTQEARLGTQFLRGRLGWQTQPLLSFKNFHCRSLFEENVLYRSRNVFLVP